MWNLCRPNFKLHWVLSCFFNSYELEAVITGCHAVASLTEESKRLVRHLPSGKSRKLR